MIKEFSEDKWYRFVEEPVNTGESPPRLGNQLEVWWRLGEKPFQVKLNCGEGDRAEYVVGLQYDRGGLITFLLPDDAHLLEETKVPVQEPAQTFTKADLKDGMKVITREPCEYVKYGEFLVGVSPVTRRPGNGHLRLSGVQEGLGWIEYGEEDPNFDIMEVYYEGELLWKREEKSEEELAKEASIKRLEEDLSKLNEAAAKLTEELNTIKSNV